MLCLLRVNPFCLLSHISNENFASSQPYIAYKILKVCQNKRTWSFLDFFGNSVVPDWNLRDRGHPRRNPEHNFSSPYLSPSFSLLPLPSSLLPLPSSILAPYRRPFFLSQLQGCNTKTLFFDRSTTALQHRNTCISLQHSKIAALVFRSSTA